MVITAKRRKYETIEITIDVIIVETDLPSRNIGKRDSSVEYVSSPITSSLTTKNVITAVPIRQAKAATNHTVDVMIFEIRSVAPFT